MSEKRYRVRQDRQWEVCDADGNVVISFGGMYLKGPKECAHAVRRQLNAAYEAGQRNPVKEEPEPQPVDELLKDYEVWRIEPRPDEYQNSLAAIDPCNNENWYYLDRLLANARFVRIYGYRRADGRLKWSNRDRMWREKGSATLDITPCNSGNVDIQSSHIAGADPMLPDAVLMRKLDC